MNTEFSRLLTLVISQNDQDIILALNYKWNNEHILLLQNDNDKFYATCILGRWLIVCES